MIERTSTNLFHIIETVDLFPTLILNTPNGIYIFPHFFIIVKEMGVFINLC